MKMKVTKMMAYNQLSQSAVYKAGEISISLTVCGGSYGGGSEVLIVESDRDDSRPPDDKG